MRKSLKTFFCFLMGVIGTLVISCSGGKNVDGFTGDGLLGDIPKARAITLATINDLAVEMSSDESLQVDLKNPRKDAPGFIEKMDRVNKKFREVEEKYEVGLDDDMKQNLLEDMNRLSSGKDFPLLNKTGLKLYKYDVTASVDTAKAEYGYLTIQFDMEQMPKKVFYKELSYVLKTKDDKVLQITPIFKDKITIGKGHIVKDLLHGMTICRDTEEYANTLKYLHMLDSVAKVEIVTKAQSLEYKPAITLQGVEPIVLGANMTKLPQRVDGVYANCYDLMANDGNMYYQFDDLNGHSLFIAQGTNDGKITDIEVDYYGFPLAINGKVLQTQVPLCYIAESFGKDIRWTYEEDNFALLASISDGKVTFRIGDNTLSERGKAKLETLKQGKYDVVFSYDDFLPDEELESFEIHKK